MNNNNSDLNVFDIENPEAIWAYLKDEGGQSTLFGNREVLVNKIKDFMKRQHKPITPEVDALFNAFIQGKLPEVYNL